MKVFSKNTLWEFDPLRYYRYDEGLFLGAWSRADLDKSYWEETLVRVETPWRNKIFTLATKSLGIPLDKLKTFTGLSNSSVSPSSNVVRYQIIEEGWVGVLRAISLF